MAVERRQSWPITDRNAAERAIAEFADQQGFAVTPAADGVGLQRGSQTRMRSSGANRVDEEQLPLKGTVSFRDDGLDVELASDHVGLVLGVGPMPATTRERFERLIDDLLADVDRRLAGA